MSQDINRANGSSIEAGESLNQFREELNKVISGDLIKGKNGIDNISTKVKGTKTTTKKQKDQKEQLQNDIRYYETLESFIRNVENGIKDLAKKKLQGEENGDDRLFEELVGFRASSGGNISSIFERDVSRSEDTGKTQRFQGITLGEAGRIVQRSMKGRADDQFSSAGHEGQDQEEKRRERRTLILHHIVNELYPYLGANAWGVHAVLRCKKPDTSSSLYKLTDSSQRFPLRQAHSTPPRVHE